MISYCFFYRQLSNIYKNSMNIQKDSVVNFLTPTKLITTPFRPKPKLSQNQAQFTHSSHKLKPGMNQQQNSKSYSSHLNKLNYQLKKSQQDIPIMKNQDMQIQYSQIYIEPKQYVMQNTSRSIINNQDNVKIYPNQKIQLENVEEKYREGSTSQVNKVDNILPSNKFQIIVKNSNKNSRISQNNALNIHKDVNLQQSKINQRQFAIQNKLREEINNRQFYKQSKHNSSVKEQIIKEYKVTPLQLMGLLQKLKDIKKIIDVSLKDLQTLLNNTSQYLNTMDEEYAKIKANVMNFTSQMLDSGYNNYKKNMVKWQKYQNVEKKAVIMSKQLNNYIEEDQIYLQQLSKMNNNTKLCNSKHHELKQKIELFNIFAAQLQASKAQCFNKRPQITKDRLKIFGEALAGLAAF